MVTTKSLKQNSEQDPPSEEHQQKKAKMTPSSPEPEVFFPCHRSRVEYGNEIAEMREMFEAGMWGWPGPRNAKEMRISTVGFRVEAQSWAIEFSKTDHRDADHLSDSQKEAIIGSLKGQCVQEKWDVFIGLCSPLIRETIFEILAEAMTHKHVVERIFLSRYWYLDGKMNASDEGDETFGARLQYLYERFHETNPNMAGLWRSETNRLANGMRPSRISSTEFGTYNQERRRSLLNRFVDETLASEPFQWLLRDLSTKEEVDKRRRRLYRVFEFASDEAVKFENSRGNPTFYEMKDLPETFTKGTGDIMIPHEYNLLHEGRFSLDGHRILICLFPGVIRRNITFSARTATEYSIPAYVVVANQ